MVTRLRHDDVEKLFTGAGYKLVSQFTKSSEKLSFVCPQGHEGSTLLQHFRKGTRCGYCNNKKIFPETVRQAFESNGYTLLEDFKRSDLPLSFICPEGHKAFMTWNSFRTGCRCIKCSRRYKLSHPEVKAAFAQEGYKLLSRSYKNSYQKLLILCPQQHKAEITYSHFTRGVRCNICAKSYVSAATVKQKFKDEKYTLLSDFVNSGSPLMFICPQGHTSYTTWNLFRDGGRCGYCSERRLTQDREESRKIASRVRGLLKVHLKRRSIEALPKSKTSWARSKAIEIFQVLGSIPDGHQLDHIVPVSFFDLRNQEEINACWSVHNLRYLPSLVNFLRKNNLTQAEIDVFSEAQMEIYKLASLKPFRYL